MMKGTMLAICDLWKNVWNHVTLAQKVPLKYHTRIYGVRDPNKSKKSIN